LVVYQRQRQLARQVFEVSKSFPREEAYSLTDQVRRASRSIGAQIAEAWAKRDYERHFLSKLTDADAEQNETQHWIETAHDCAYLSSSQSKELLNFCDEIGRMLRSMKEHSADFCSPTSTRLRETPDFFAEPAPTEH
jgi:four helix bundle protein